jgi:hypothetical protein
MIGAGPASGFVPCLFASIKKILSSKLDYASIMPGDNGRRGTVEDTSVSGNQANCVLKRTALRPAKVKVVSATILTGLIVEENRLPQDQAVSSAFFRRPSKRE